MSGALKQQPIKPGTRSRYKCFIVFVGLTGTGKSNTINTLFDRNAQFKKKFSSDTQTIIEYRIAKGQADPSDDFIVIDTPGFHDTDGTQKDARIMATLEEYLAKHGSLGKSYPSAVLLVIRFDDETIYSSNSYLVQFMQALEKLIENGTLIDAGEKTCNLVIVMTRFMDADEEVRKHPHDRITLIKGIIKTYTRIPLTVRFVFAENEAKAFKLPESDGHYTLPTGDQYPKNVYVALKDIFESSGDMMAIDVIEKAFSRNHPLLKNEIDQKLLVREGHQASMVYFHAINRNKFSVAENETEVSRQLDKYWYQLPEKKRKASELFLNVTKAVLFSENIHTENDIPYEPAAVVKLIQKLPMNQILKDILLKLQLQAPDIYDFCESVGQFYKFQVNNISSTCVLNKEPKQISFIGFTTPWFMEAMVIGNKETRKKIIYEIEDTQEAYVKRRLSHIGVFLEKEEKPKFDIQLAPGYNVIAKDEMPADNRISAVIEYRHYLNTLAGKYEVIPSYLESLEKLGRYSESTKASWIAKLSEGCHLLAEVYLGGYVEIVAKHGSTSASPNKDKALQCMKDILEKIGTSCNYDDHELLENWKFSISYHGGCVERPSLAKIFTPRGAEAYERWERSIPFQPAALKTELKLKHISSIIDKSEKYDLAENVSNALYAIYGLKKHTSSRPVEGKDEAKCTVM